MLQDTGERVVPEKMKITNELLVEHIARYHFATYYAHGRVLDFACGVGYGSHIISKKCKGRVLDVIGVDIDEEALRYARSNYYHPLSSFLKEDVTDPNIPAKLGTFDTIISFETYEHIKEEKQFLSNIYQLLKPKGTLILSTPFGKGRGKPCGSPFHVHQITENEFKHLFNDYSYSAIDFYFQKGALIVPDSFRGEEYFPLGIAVCQKK